jgi:hypothetical protein
MNKRQNSGHASISFTPKAIDVSFFGLLLTKLTLFGKENIDQCGKTEEIENFLTNQVNEQWRSLVHFCLTFCESKFATFQIINALLLNMFKEELNEQKERSNEKEWKNNENTNKKQEHHFEHMEQKLPTNLPMIDNATQHQTQQEQTPTKTQTQHLINLENEQELNEVIEHLQSIQETVRKEAMNLLFSFFSNSKITVLMRNKKQFIIESLFDRLCNDPSK